LRIVGLQFRVKRMSTSGGFEKSLKLHAISKTRTLLLALGLAVAGGALQGCGSSTSGSTLTSASTSCSSNTIQLGIGEGFIQHFCGCTNLVAGAVSIQPTTGFTCAGPAPSASTPTVVFFLYINPISRHLIEAVSTPANGFTAGPLIDPSQQDLIIRSHALVITASGTYDFQDAFNNSVSGRLSL